VTVPSISGVDVDMLYCYPDIVMYTGDYADDTPTQRCSASGNPPGGTYEWECTTTGNGELAIVSGQGTDAVYIKGASESLSALDAKITVKYTLGGCTAEAFENVTVRRPLSTTAAPGLWEYTDNGRRISRRYYHIIKDQFGQVITLTNMPVSEQVVCTSGTATDVTESDGVTHNYLAEWDPPQQLWIGGVAVRDTLGCLTDMQNSEYDQTLTVGGWTVYPVWKIYMQPSDPNPDQFPPIWKE